ncbi:hypothetical protein [Paraclostridium bifermentans]|uniref:hypothetical protein n=1 Tax=Paraclostridium bifermentans TaxID=1490 RepID=UPI0034DF74D0
MKPVVVDRKERFKELQEQLTQDINVEAKKNIVNKVIVKLQKNKKLIKEEAVFKSLSGNKAPAEFIKELKKIDTQSVINALIENYKVVEHTRGCGKGKKQKTVSTSLKYIKSQTENKIRVHII